MKVKVLKDFIDKNTQILNEKSNEIECTEERFEEINNAGFGMLVEKVEHEEKQKDNEKVEEKEESKTKQKKPKK